MYIERLDRSRVLVALDSDEMSLFSVEGGRFSGASVRLLGGLFGLIASKEGISLKRRKVKVELLKGSDTFFIIISLSDIALLPSGNVLTGAVLFDSSYDLCLCTQRLRSFSPLCITELYKLSGKYILFVTDRSCNSTLKPLLSEYGKLLPSPHRVRLYLEEFADKTL